VRKAIIPVILLVFHILFAQNGQQFIALGDFELLNGQTIRNCRMGYRTFGHLNPDQSNVIIYPTWFGGTSEGIGRLIGPDRLVDSTDFYIIALDALGNGISSSPSNSDAQPGEAFPRFTIRDMVHAQRLLLERLGIAHVYAAIGGSMGSFQVFEWLVTYPEFIDRAVPYVCSPRLTSYDLLWINFQLEIIESGQACRMAVPKIHRLLDIGTSLMGRTPEYRVDHTDRNDFLEFFAQFDKISSNPFTLIDKKRQLQAMQSYDITQPFQGSLPKAAAAIQSNVFMIISDSDHIVNPAPAKNLAQLMDAEILILENNCGHLAVGCELQQCARKIAQFLEQ